MLIPTWILLVSLLPGGDATIPCSTYLIQSYTINTKPDELWNLTCEEHWSDDGEFKIGNRLAASSVAPNCSNPTTPDLFVYVYNRFDSLIDYGSVRNTSIVWNCEVVNTFDSQLNVAASNVAKSPSYWSLFGIALGAGLFIATVRKGINEVYSLIEGSNEKDD